MSVKTEIEAHETAVELKTIDITPKWKGVLRLLLEGYTRGTATGRQIALEELYRMADLADRYTAEHKEDAQ